LSLVTSYHWLSKMIYQTALIQKLWINF
jgi:hypothetical protein